MIRSTLPAATLAIVILGSADQARAEPQGNASLTVGVAGRGYDRDIWRDTSFHLGLRGDVLFGRKGTRDFGAGPYAEVLTHDFDEIQLGGGGELLLPVIDSIPIVVSAGAYGRKGPDVLKKNDPLLVPGGYGFEPGLAWGVFFGSRSYNFTTNYVMALGLLTQFRYGLGESHETSIVVSAQLDLAFLGLPIVYIVDAIRGGSRETDRVPRR